VGPPGAGRDDTQPFGGRLLAGLEGIHVALSMVGFQTGGTEEKEAGLC